MTRQQEPGSNVRLDHWLDTVERMDMGPLDHLTCNEVQSLAELMAYHRGEEKGMQVIVDHIGDDEEDDELREHLSDWPELAAAMRERYSHDTRMIQLLNDVEAEAGR